MSKKQKKRLIKKLKEFLKNTVLSLALISVYVPILAYGVIHNTVY